MGLVPVPTICRYTEPAGGDGARAERAATARGRPPSGVAARAVRDGGNRPSTTEIDRRRPILVLQPGSGSYRSDVDFEPMIMNLKKGSRCVINRDEDLTMVDFDSDVSLAEKELTILLEPSLKIRLDQTIMPP
ncbi:hypothetical protein GW17_00055655 [Ensete ventricosum]|nr:hypothetical protein GW17_00055655 [Ensete ventricosum]